jgi:threonine aldolase
MGNTIGLKLHTRHGQEIICDSRSHIFNYELSMMAWFAGCVARPIATADGILSWAEVREQIRPLGPHSAPTGCIEIENTHNMAGGTIYPLDTIREICSGAHALGLKVHMDGARVFNAAAATGVAVSEICAGADTVMFCLSKGLGAPAGSMLVGRKDAIAEGRLYRKRLGGGMRQVGVLAAPGLIALEEMPARLSEDHDNARWLAEGLANTPGIQIDLSKVQTNIVIFDVTGTGLSAQEFSARLKAEGVLMNGINARAVRLVTHCDVNRKDCERALAVISEVTRCVGAKA